MLAPSHRLHLAQAAFVWSTLPDDFVLQQFINFVSGESELPQHLSRVLSDPRSRLATRFGSTVQGDRRPYPRGAASVAIVHVDHHSDRTRLRVLQSLPRAVHRARRNAGGVKARALGGHVVAPEFGLDQTLQLCTMLDTTLGMIEEGIVRPLRVP